MSQRDGFYLKLIYTNEAELTEVVLKRDGIHLLKTVTELVRETMERPSGAV